MTTTGPTWTIAGRLIDATGTPVKYGVITITPSSLPVASGTDTIVAPAVLRTDGSGNVPPTPIDSIPGATWSLQTLANGAATIADPGDGATVLLNSLIAWGTPPVSATEAQSLRSVLTQEQAQRTAADQVLSNRLDTIQGITVPGTGPGGIPLPSFTTETTTGSPGAQAAVTASGDYPDFTLAFDIPAGQPGADGTDGAAGHSPLVSFKDSQIVVDGVVGPDLRGPQGVQGVAGPQGPQGIPGANSTVPGPQGATGPQGTPGTAGATGPQGPIGPQGPVGPQGPQGSIGPKGDTGPQGAAGPTGPSGTDGATGATGPQGPAPAVSWSADVLTVGGQSSPPLTGPQGPKGTDGTGISISGSVATSTDLPGTAAAGDAYVAEDTGHLWVYGDTWVDAGQFRGDTGATGPQGPAGPKGDTGAQGATGDTGPQGATGPTGPQGLVGPSGAQGPQGDVGPQGPAGADSTVPGPEGPAGHTPVLTWTGDQLTVDGTPGPSLTGPQGPTGPQGQQGIQGVQGPIGDSGPQGPQGPSGVTSDAGTAAIVTNSASHTAAALNALYVSATTLGNYVTTNTVTAALAAYNQIETDTDGVPYYQPGPITPPQQGFMVGSVTSGTTASASITQQGNNQVLNLVLPQGDPGAPGVSGVPTDAGLATALAAAGSQTKSYLDSTYIAQDVQNSTVAGYVGTAGPTQSALDTRYGPAAIDAHLGGDSTNFLTKLPTIALGVKTDAFRLTASSDGDQVSALTAFLADPTLSGVRRIVGTVNLGGQVRVPAGVTIDARRATFVQTAGSTILLKPAAGARIHGGQFVGLSTDYVAGTGSPSSIGIYCDGLGSATTPTYVEGVVVTGFAGAGIYAINAHVNIDDCQVYGVNGVAGMTIPAQDSSCFGVYVNGGCDDATIRNVRIENTSIGLIASLDSHRLTLAGGRFRNIPGQHGAYLQNGTGLLVTDIGGDNVNLNLVKLQQGSGTNEDAQGPVFMGITGRNVGDNVLSLNNIANSLPEFGNTLAGSYKIYSATVANVSGYNTGRLLYLGSIRGGSVTSVAGYNCTTDGVTILDCQDLQVHNVVTNTTGNVGIRLTTATGALNQRIVLRGVETVNPGQSGTAGQGYGVFITGDSSGNDGRDVTIDGLRAYATNGKMTSGLLVNPAAHQESLRVRNSTSVGYTSRPYQLASATRDLAEWINNPGAAATLNFPVGRPVRTGGSGDQARYVCNALPTSGVFAVGDRIDNSAPVASGTAQWVCTAAGGKASGLWAASTTYAVGTYVQTSPGRIIQCIVGGTSGSTEPVVTGAVGSATFTDGGVTWLYMASAPATLKATSTVAA